MSDHTYLTYPFLRNKYYTHYIRLMETRQALNRPYVSSETHRHHILPECLLGPDIPKNKVVLLHKEHFIAHALLVRITEGSDHYKMVFAFNRMCWTKSKEPSVQTKFRHFRNSRVYTENTAKVPAALSATLKGVPKTQKHKDAYRASYTQERKDKQRARQTGIPQTQTHNDACRASWTQERKDNQIKRQTGKKIKPWSEERKAAHSLRCTGRKGRTWTDEQKLVQSIKHKLLRPKGSPGHPHTQENIDKIRNRVTLWWKTRPQDERDTALLALRAGHRNKNIKIVEE